MHASDHPNARHQKRPVEEKGAFGKSTRRTGSARNTRTQTPAKRENPTLDGFEAALKHDSQRIVESSSLSNSTNGQPGVLASIDSNAGLHNTLSINKEPKQIILYGYSPDTQWAALSFYENVSGGLICEDYERQPPLERRRYQISLGYSGYTHPRPLTKVERALACQYSGGACWIKVTLDSAEAAERPISNSPHHPHGHWVYAELFSGQGPAIDEPILVREDEDQGPSAAPRLPQTIGASFSISALRRSSAGLRGTATLPKSFATTSTLSKTYQHQNAEVASVTSSTVSSATATEPEYPDLRRRSSNPTGSYNIDIQSQSRSTTFTHFPNTARTQLRPASDAFLPQPSWQDRLFRGLTQSGWIPGDIIGNAVPRLENGDFDWHKASFYWRLCYWLDSYIGTDICGIKES